MEKKEDLISRQAAIDAVNNLTYSSSLVDVKRKLVDLPAAHPHWIPVTERLPEQQYIHGVPLYQEFFVTVAERWPGEDWKYITDIGNIPGDYIDCFWGTMNDWDEGQEAHVVAWMPLPEPYKEGQDDTD